MSSYTFNYTLELPKLSAFRKDLTVTAIGYNDTLTKKTKIFVRNCKSDYHVCLLFLNYCFRKLSYHKCVIW